MKTYATMKGAKIPGLYEEQLVIRLRDLVNRSSVTHISRPDNGREIIFSKGRGKIVRVSKLNG